MAIFKGIVAEHAGDRIYIQKTESIEKKQHRNRKIKEAFKESNYLELASQFDMEERHIRRIVHETP
jgi:Mor family transcriptional regulator